MKKKILYGILATVLWIAARPALYAQPAIPAGQVDIFMGVDFNYRDIWWRRLYDLLINLTPGVKWNMGRGWQVAAGALVPVYNDYGERYKRIRLDLLVLSKEMGFSDRLCMKISGGWFSGERYGMDLKGMWAIAPWLALEAQTGFTGHCSMAAGWEASKPGRWTGLLGPAFYLHPYDTEIRIRGGRYVYEDHGGSLEGMRHFTHCTVGLYGQYSNRGGSNAGFKVIVMLPPYKRRRHKVNFRPASNFRLTYNKEADAYANRMYLTDPEENEREGWFDPDRCRWGRNLTQRDFTEKKKGARSSQKVKEGEL